MTSKSTSGRGRFNHQRRADTDIEPEIAPVAVETAAPAVATRRAARLLAAMGLASIKAVLEPMVRSIRRRALLAVIVGLLWLTAICYALVALTMVLALWVGPVWATAAMAVLLALGGIGLHLAARPISRPRF